MEWEVCIMTTGREHHGIGAHEGYELGVTSRHGKYFNHKFHTLSNGNNAPYGLSLLSPQVLNASVAS